MTTKRISKPVRFAIGIDPPKGWAVYDRDSKELIELKTLDFWQTVDELNRFVENLIGESGYQDYRLLIVIEAGWLNPPIFPRGIEDSKIREKIAQNVGENKAAGKLLQELLLRIAARDLERIKILEMKPSKATGSKLNATQFAKKTGWTFSSSEHSRDAAMLVFGR